MTLCRGTTYNIYPGNFSAYLWLDGSTANHFSATMPGTYIVTVTNEYQCSATDSLHITGIKELPVNFMPDTMTVCTGQSAILKPAGNFKDYFWSNNSTASSINVSQAGICWLQVSNADGCVNKDSTIVTLKACNKQVVFPTGFTPNHDGLNDIFRAKVFGSLEKFHMMIYNRFGQKVFETSDLQTGWDGALNGKLQDNGTYVWICQYQFSGAANGELQKGTITLLK